MDKSTCNEWLNQLQQLIGLLLLVVVVAAGGGGDGERERLRAGGPMSNHGDLLRAMRRMRIRMIIQAELVNI